MTLRKNGIRMISMPKVNDVQRARLIDSMARRESIHVAEALLEEAIQYRDAKLVKTAASMLHSVLTATTSYDSYIKLDKHGKARKRRLPVVRAVEFVPDAFHSTKKGESLRPFPCKPEDCMSCFWRVWCQMKETFDLLKEADQALKRGRELLKKSDKSPTKEEARRRGENSFQIIADSRASLAEYNSRHGGSSKQMRVRRHHTPPRRETATDLTVGEWDPLSKKYVKRRGENN